MHACSWHGAVLSTAVVALLGGYPVEVRAQCQRAKLTAPDGAPDDHFGEAVALSGDVAVVGAHRNANKGAAYVFERAGGEWAATAKLVTSGSGSGLHIGRSVAVDGGVIVVGADALWVGAFERDANGVWSQVAQLIPDDYTSGSLFGYAGALSAGTALVSAPEDNDNGWGSGSVYVFQRDPNGAWAQIAKLLPDDGDGGDEFGGAVTLEGRACVVGAPDDEDQGTWSGSAYVFERDLNGVWSQAAKLLANDGRPFSWFGSSVGVSGNLALVGAPDGDGADFMSGAVYVFERDPDGAWPEVAKLIASDGASYDGFGRAVAVDGQIAVVGAPGDDDNGDASGSAYVFVRDTTRAWQEVAKLVPADGGADKNFGSALGVGGNTALIGMYRDDPHGFESGSAYVFAVGPDEDTNGIMDICECTGDLDADWDIDFADLWQLLTHYNTTSGASYEDGDLDGDGDVDLSDLAELLGHYGQTCD